MEAIDIIGVIVPMAKMGANPFMMQIGCCQITVDKGCAALANKAVLLPSLTDRGRGNTVRCR